VSINFGKDITHFRFIADPSLASLSFAAGARDIPVSHGRREFGGGTTARCGVARIYDQFPSLAARRAAARDQLSGGEQQMLAIGRALMGNPFLLLDEPLEGLAPVIVDQLLAA
jgi:ATPase subunit of ABC transporter with duplicated ATPase domains